MLVNMREMLEKARTGHYAVGFFNAVNVEMARAVIESAQELEAPVIIGTAEILLPVMSLNRGAEYLIPMAEEADVPVAVHYDHGLTFEKCIEAVKLGFTSVMYDCSTLAYRENTERVAEMVRICHAEDVTVEAELGHVGDNEGEGKLSDPSDYFTDPDTAFEYVQSTGADALAVAVGNAHGDYKFPPKLDFDRIKVIAQSTRIPLVLHGGSGLSEHDFKTAIREGIAKVNIFTDIDKAGRNGIAEGILAGENVMTKLMDYEIRAMKEAVKQKILLFGSDGKA